MFILILLKCGFFASVLASTNQTNTVLPLDKVINNDNKELYGGFFYVNQSSTLHVSFEKVNPNVTYIIFQVHSYLHNITVYNNSLHSTTFRNGTNLGFYSPVDSLDTYFISNKNENVDLKIYISVQGYRDSDPIPGGCAMENPNTNPSIDFKYNNGFMYIEVSPPRAMNDDMCLHSSNLTITFWAFYLPQINLNSDIYFESIRMMMTKSSFRKQIQVPLVYWPNRRMVSIYPGTPAIYLAVARDYHTKGYSIYVPSYSNACAPWAETCDLLDDGLSQFLCASLLFVGIFICYFGHRFFKTEMFIMGLVAGVTVAYILISLMTTLDQTLRHEAIMAGSVISGIFFGAIWLLFWWFYPIPMMSVLLPTLNLGFLGAAILYHSAFDYFQSSHIDNNFWAIFVLIVLATAVILMPITFHANILCCGVLGAYSAVYPIDYYLGSNLKYIIINTIRRATIPGFKRALLVPSFQMRESLILALWILIAVTGMGYQYYTSRGRPPFPPPPRSTRQEPPNYGTVARPRRPTSAIPRTYRGQTNEREPLLRSA